MLVVLCGAVFVLSMARSRAAAGQAQIDAAREAGALGYIVKTVEPVDLPSVLRKALSGGAFAVWGTKEEPKAVATWKSRRRRV